MTKQEFERALREYAQEFNQAVATPEGEWIIKGFIDVFKTIYTISVDTKVISKVMELLLLPKLCEFAKKYELKMVLAKHQNFYPDISFVDSEGNKFALDLKSTYRISDTKVNGMTLGTFTGYFRNRQSTKNITFPYASYRGHFVLGIIYSKSDKEIDERRRYSLDELESIISVVRDIQFFVQEKYKIASDRPGSGNTKNIGSVTSIEALVNGKGPFAALGEEVFDDYWMYYMTKDMARTADLEEPPYHNLESYFEYKRRGLV